MKRIIYTCDRCGKEIDADRYHITICKEIPAGEPELIGNSADRDYCQSCMKDAVSFLVTGFLDCETETVAPEETITEHVPPDPEDMEEPEESVMCELWEMAAEVDKKRRAERIKPELRDRIIELCKNGVAPREISATLGVEKRIVYNTIQHAKEKGLI